MIAKHDGSWRLAGALLWQLMACSGGEVTHPEPPARVQPSSQLVLPAEADAVLEPAAFLIDTPEKAFPRRATIARFGALRFGPDDTGFIAAPRRDVEGVFPELVVLENGPRFARVLLRASSRDGDQARIAAYVEVADLQRVTLERTTLMPPSGKPASDAGVELYTGAPVEVIASEPGRDKLRSVITATQFRGKLEVFGWAVSPKYGYVYVPEARTVEPATHDVNGPFEIWTAPTGEVIAKVTPAHTHPAKVRKVGDPKDGYQTVVIEGERVSVRGIIPAATLIPLTDIGPFARIGLPPSALQYLLPKGTSLFAGARGKQVGVLTKDTHVEDRSLDDGGRRMVAVNIPPWESLPVWVEKALLESVQREKLERERKRQALIARVQLKITRRTNVDWRSDVELDRQDIATCVEKAESSGPALSGKGRVLVTLPPGGRSRWEASGPLAANAEMKRCLEIALGSGVGWADSTREGTLDASIDVAPPNPEPPR